MSCQTENIEFLPQAIVGQKVPPFVLDAYDPEDFGFTEIDFAKIQQEGKWTVLVFYPADFTFVCPTELADLASKHAKLEKLGVEVVSVSTDSKFVHLAWKNDEQLLKDVKFKMGADPTGEVSSFFNVYDPEVGQALRGTFIIDPDGVLVASEINFFNVGRDADELLRKVEASIYVRENPAEVCPAKWKPGEKTLKPSKELVGKVYEDLND